MGNDCLDSILVDNETRQIGCCQTSQHIRMNPMSQPLCAQPSSSLAIDKCKDGRLLRLVLTLRRYEVFGLELSLGIAVRVPEATVPGSWKGGLKQCRDDSKAKGPCRHTIRRWQSRAAGGGKEKPGSTWRRSAQKLDPTVSWTSDELIDSSRTLIHCFSGPYVR